MLKAIISWSGGKDCAMALWKVLCEGKFEVVGLLTTISLPYNRISMHGIRRELLEEQAISTGLPVFTVQVSEKTNAAYEDAMLIAFAKLKAQGITHIIFGDIFLEDLRIYREQLLERAELKCIFLVNLTFRVDSITSLTMKVQVMLFSFDDGNMSVHTEIYSFAEITVISSRYFSWILKKCFIFLPLNL